MIDTTQVFFLVPKHKCQWTSEKSVAYFSFRPKVPRTLQTQQNARDGPRRYQSSYFDSGAPQTGGQKAFLFFLSLRGGPGLPGPGVRSAVKARCSRTRGDAPGRPVLGPARRCPARRVTQLQGRLLQHLLQLLLGAARHGPGQAGTLLRGHLLPGHLLRHELAGEARGAEHHQVVRPLLRRHDESTASRSPGRAESTAPAPQAATPVPGAATAAGLAAVAAPTALGSFRPARGPRPRPRPRLLAPPRLRGLPGRRQVLQRSLVGLGLQVGVAS